MSLFLKLVSLRIRIHLVCHSLNPSPVVICRKISTFAYPHTSGGWIEPPATCCDLQKNQYLCVSAYIFTSNCLRSRLVVICRKISTFAYPHTSGMKMEMYKLCCDLQKNQYLCVSVYISVLSVAVVVAVVICRKISTFAYPHTSPSEALVRPSGCDLQKNQYLCVSAYIVVTRLPWSITVVICRKISTFAYPHTSQSVE